MLIMLFIKAMMNILIIVINIIMNLYLNGDKALIKETQMVLSEYLENNKMDNREHNNYNGDYRQIIDNLYAKFMDIKYGDIPLFDNLRFHAFCDNLVISRTDINQDDKINLPNLELFKWQHGIPIESSFYNRNKTFTIEELKEVDIIKNQDKKIVLNVKKEYELPLLERVIISWYADPKLTENIRKIEYSFIDPKVDYNDDIITIYPKYGKIDNVITNLEFKLMYNLHMARLNDLDYKKINNLMWIK